MQVYKVTKYNPEDWDERGRYIGPHDTVSDCGPLEAAYLAAVEAFAAAAGVTSLTIREPEAGELDGLFPPDLSGYHDGAQVLLATGVALVRGMLRGDGAWCRLEVDDRFFVHVGWDQYMYLGCSSPCDDAVALTRSLGLFPEPLDRSPYDPYFDELEVPRPADEAFWSEVTELALERGTVILEENFVANASRWHRLQPSDVPPVRDGLTPRARLAVWPELNEDVVAELRTLDDRDFVTIVWEDRDGRITDFHADGEDRPAIAVRLAKAKSVRVLSGYADEYDPLLHAVLPDDDGVVRVRRSV